MNDKNHPTSPEFEGTRIDLGEDLLAEETRLLEVERAAKSNVDSVEHVTELLKNATILVNEGLLPDAKKTLRQILILDSRNQSAQDLLETIQAEELAQIMGDGERRTSSRRHSGYSHSIEIHNPEEVILKLDQDLGLGLFSDQVTIGMTESMPYPGDLKSLKSFYAEVEKNLADGSPQDWIDLGVGFMEMNFYQISAWLFQGAVRRLDPGHKDFHQLNISANCLLAFSFILSGEPVEAIAKIESMLRDLDTQPQEKTELFYLMGLTYQSMKKPRLAFQFYRKVIEIDPQYRDTERRIKAIQTGKSES